MVVTALLVVAVAMLACGLVLVARSAARDERARRDQPRDRAAEQARRRQIRVENVEFTRHMLFGGRGGDSPRRDPDDRDED